jgi:ABC-type glutathione transport system ATPase component
VKLSTHRLNEPAMSGLQVWGRRRFQERRLLITFVERSRGFALLDRMMSALEQRSEMVKRSAVALSAHGRQQCHRVSTARIVQHTPWLVAFRPPVSTLYVIIRATLILNLTILL